MTTPSTVLLAATALAGTLAAAPAGAAITSFANYSGVGGSNIFWQRTGSTYNANGTAQQQAASAAAAAASAGGHLFTIAAPTSTTPGAVDAVYTFLNPQLYALGPLDASFRFDATAEAGSGAQSAASFVYQPIFSGTFSFTYTGTADLHVGHTTFHSGANLLSAAFTGGTISGQAGATSGSATASTSVPGEAITYTSDFIDFGRTRDQDLALSMTSISRALGFTANEALHSFAATTTGSFSTDPLPSVPSAAPEPASWALLTAGFGLIGLRRRARAIA